VDFLQQRKPKNEEVFELSAEVSPRMKNIKIDKEMLKQRMAKSSKAYEEVKTQAIAAGVFDQAPKMTPVGRILPSAIPTKKGGTKRQ
jgi:hypothetical protein